MSRNYLASTEETETYFFEQPSPMNPKGVYVKIKLRLTWGERKRLDSAAVTTMSTQQLQAAANGQAVDGAEQEEVARTMTYGLNLFVPNFLKLACYILEWNLTDGHGRLLRLDHSIDARARMIERLDETVGDEIAAFIDGVVERQAKALEAAKAKDEDGGTLNGQVVSSSSRALGSDDEGNPTPPAPGPVLSDAWKLD